MLTACQNDSDTSTNNPPQLLIDLLHADLMKISQHLLSYDREQEKNIWPWYKSQGLPLSVGAGQVHFLSPERGISTLLQVGQEQVSWLCFPL